MQYAIRVDGNFATNLNVSGPFTAPANDNLASATNITAASLPFSQTVNTVAASVEGSEPVPTCSSSYRHSSIWYTFTPATNGLYRFDTVGSSGSGRNGPQTALSLFAAPALSFGSLTPLLCDTYDTGVATLLTIELTAGVQYAVRLTAPTDFGLTSAKLNLTDLPDVPDNDNLGAATTIGSLPFTESLDTRGASLEASEPTASCYSSRYSSVWYLFTPGTAGH